MGMETPSDAANNAIRAVQGFTDRERREKNTRLTILKFGDDWSFVIKAHAVIEAAISQMIVERLGMTSLQDFVYRLTLLGKTGKVDLAQTLGLLNAKQVHFIRWFSELRNCLVHRVENLDFSFASYLASMDASKKNEVFAKVECPFDNFDRAEWNDYAKQDLKDALYHVIEMLVDHCTHLSAMSKADQMVSDYKDQLFKTSLKELPEPEKGRE
jgi:hypothetical protein